MKKIFALFLVAAMLITASAGYALAGGEHTFIGEAQGFGGTVTAYVTVDESDRITDLTVIGPDETIGKGSVAIEEMPRRIVEANSVEVDGTTGASFTSQAIREAVTAALENREEGMAPTMEEGIIFTPGTYTASSFAHNFPLVVEVTFAEDRIEAVKITEDKSDVAMSRAVGAAIPSAIVEQGGVPEATKSGAGFDPRTGAGHGKVAGQHDRVCVSGAAYG